MICDEGWECQNINRIPGQTRGGSSSSIQSSADSSASHSSSIGKSQPTLQSTNSSHYEQALSVVASPGPQAPASSVRSARRSEIQGMSTLAITSQPSKNSLSKSKSAMAPGLASAAATGASPASTSDTQPQSPVLHSSPTSASQPQPHSKAPAHHPAPRRSAPSPGKSPSAASGLHIRSGSRSSPFGAGRSMKPLEEESNEHLDRTLGRVAKQVSAVPQRSAATNMYQKMTIMMMMMMPKAPRFHSATLRLSARSPRMMLMRMIQAMIMTILILMIKYISNLMRKNKYMMCRVLVHLLLVALLTQIAHHNHLQARRANPDRHWFLTASPGQLGALPRLQILTHWIRLLFRRQAHRLLPSRRAGSNVALILGLLVVSPHQ